MQERMKRLLKTRELWWYVRHCDPLKLSRVVEGSTVFAIPNQLISSSHYKRSQVKSVSTRPQCDKSIYRNGHVYFS